MLSTVRQTGFSLIELMIAVVIAAIIAAIAVPTYQEHLRRGKRAAAQAEMMDIANRQHQFFPSNRAYASKSALEATGYALPTEVANTYAYNITIGSGTVPSFLITMTPTGNQAGTGEPALTLNNQGVKTPAEKWQ